MAQPHIIIVGLFLTACLLGPINQQGAYAQTATASTDDGQTGTATLGPILTEESTTLEESTIEPAGTTQQEVHGTTEATLPPVEGTTEATLPPVEATTEATLPPVEGTTEAALPSVEATSMVVEPTEPTVTPEPAWCYTCEFESDNEECNFGEDGTANIEYCDQVQPTCWTQLRFNERGNGYRIEAKGCMEADECYDIWQDEMFSSELMTCHGDDVPNAGLVCNYCCSRFSMPGCNDEFAWYLTLNEPNEWDDALDAPGSGVRTFVNTLLVLAAVLFLLM